MLHDINNATLALGHGASWVAPLCFALFGACIGSFLNVVIYRLPRGLGVNEPRRSFCPRCQTPIPWRLNIPVISWLLLRGRSACCRQPIPFRYWLVETATALLFAGIGWQFSYDGLIAQTMLCVWAAALLATLCIDWEQMAVLPSLTGIAAGAGLLASLFSPWLAEPNAVETTDGLLWSLGGAAFGFLLLKTVSLLGRLFLGHKAQHYKDPLPWDLRQTGDDLTLTIGGDPYLWSELFLESSNRVQLEGATLSSRPDAAPGTISFTEDSFILPDGSRLKLEDFESLSGECRGLVTRKEAMGSGDAWIALAIGTACGWQGILFALAAGSFIGLLWAALARIKRGQPMPFGPSFIAGAFIWLFWGNQLLNGYLSGI